MKLQRDLWIEPICAVERESAVVAVSFRTLAQALHGDPSFLSNENLGKRVFSKAESNRESTYLIRSFSIFENGLREAWAKSVGKLTSPL